MLINVNDELFFVVINYALMKVILCIIMFRDNNKPLLEPEKHRQISKYLLAST